MTIEGNLPKLSDVRDAARPPLIWVRREELRGGRGVGGTGRGGGGRELGRLLDVHVLRIFPKRLVVDTGNQSRIKVQDPQNWNRIKTKWFNFSSPVLLFPPPSPSLCHPTIEYCDVFDTWLTLTRSSEILTR